MNKLACFFCLALVVASATLRADPITYAFSGNLAYGVNDPNNNFGGVLYSGQSFTGTVSYDTSTPSEGGTSTYEDYAGSPFNGYQAALTFDFAGGYTITDSTNWFDDIRTCTDCGWDVLFWNYRPTEPSFWVGSSYPSNVTLGLEFDASLTGLDIPSTLQIEPGLSMFGEFGVGPGSSDFYGEITSLTPEESGGPVPEPSTLLLLGGGMTAIARKFRRKV